MSLGQTFVAVLAGGGFATGDVVTLPSASGERSSSAHGGAKIEWCNGEFSFFDKTGSNAWSELAGTDVTVDVASSGVCSGALVTSNGAVAACSFAGAEAEIGSGSGAEFSGGDATTDDSVAGTGDGDGSGGATKTAIGGIIGSGTGAGVEDLGNTAGSVSEGKTFTPVAKPAGLRTRATAEARVGVLGRSHKVAAVFATSSQQVAAVIAISSHPLRNLSSFLRLLGVGAVMSFDGVSSASVFGSGTVET